MECFQIANFLLTKHLFFQWLTTPDQALLPYAMIPLDGTHIVLDGTHNSQSASTRRAQLSVAAKAIWSTDLLNHNVKT